MKKILYLTLYFLKFLLTNSIYIDSVNPNYAIKDFSSQIDTHNTIIGVKLEGNVSDNIIIHIGFLHENYDRVPPEYGYIYCLNNKNKIVRDWSYQENYYYSCCRFNYIENNVYYYNCPIPPAEKDPDPFRTLISDDVSNIYIKQMNNQSKWILSDKTFTYRNELTFSGFLKKMLVIIFLLIIFCITANSLVEFINDWSNKHPRVSTVLHILCTIFTVIVQVIISNNIEKNPNNILKKYSIHYSTITLLYSLFIIYIPSKKDDLYSTKIDQRVIISNKTKYLYRFLKMFKKKIFKNIFSFVFCILIVFQLWAIYSILDCLKENFDVEIEILIGAGILLFLLSIIYIIAFMTGIYDIKIPLKISKDGNVTEITNYKRELLKNRINPSNNNNYVGFYNDEDFIDYNIKLIKENDLLVIDTDITNINSNYNYLIWKIGYIKNKEIILDEKLLKKKSIRGCINKKIGIIKLYKRSSYDTLNIYKVIKPKEEKNFGYIHYGYIKNNYVHTDENCLLKLISFIFKLIPEHDEKYNYNIVDNLRAEWYKMTYKSCINFGVVYWFLFLLFTLLIITYEIYMGTNFINILMIITMIFYVINVNIRLFKIPLKKKGNSIYSLLNKMKSNTRGSSLINKYSINYNFIKSLNYVELKNINKINYKNDLEYIKLDNNSKKKFFYNIELQNKNTIIGLGVLNENLNNNLNKNIFNIFTVGFWYSGLSDDLAFLVNNEFSWRKENNDNNKIKFGIGVINNKIILKINNNNFYCRNGDKNKICLFFQKNCKFVIKKAIIELEEYNNIIKLDNLNKNFNNELCFNIPTLENTNDIKFTSGKNWNDELTLCLKSKEYFYEWNLINEVNIEQNIIEKNKKIFKKFNNEGFYLLFNKLEFTIDMDPLEIEFEINLKKVGICPNFCVIGLIDCKDIYSNNYLNLVPGWRGSSSIGYHSDDGSINYSNKNNTYFRKTELLKYSLNNNIIIKIGYDGECIYFANNNNRFVLDSKIVKRWENNNKFNPVIYLDGIFNSIINLKINK